MILPYAERADEVSLVGRRFDADCSEDSHEGREIAIMVDALRCRRGLELHHHKTGDSGPRNESCNAFSIRQVSQEKLGAGLDCQHATPCGCHSQQARLPFPSFCLEVAALRENVPEEALNGEMIKRPY